MVSNFFFSFVNFLGLSSSLSLLRLQLHYSVLQFLSNSSREMNSLVTRTAFRNWMLISRNVTLLSKRNIASSNIQPKLQKDEYVFSRYYLYRYIFLNIIPTLKFRNEELIKVSIFCVIEYVNIKKNYICKYFINLDL